jgi:hypothetical protein
MRLFSETIRSMSWTHNESIDGGKIVIWTDMEDSTNAKLVVEAEAEQTAVEGWPAVFVCNVSAFPQPIVVQWMRVVEDGSLPLLEQQRSGDFGFGMYLVSNAVDETQAGFYRCQGLYNFGTDYRDIELVVLSLIVILL